MTIQKNNKKTIMKPLSGKTAIVTGASSGIGRATALTLAQAGAAVVIHARRKDRLTKVALDIQKKGGKALAVAGDASLRSDIDKLLEQTLKWKEGGRKYDIVVVNAGRGLAGSTLLSDHSQWEDVYHTNVLGAAYLMRCAAKYFIGRKKGDIVADRFCRGAKHFSLQRVLRLQQICHRRYRGRPASGSLRAWRASISGYARHCNQRISKSCRLRRR